MKHRTDNIIAIVTDALKVGSQLCAIGLLLFAASMMGTIPLYANEMSPTPLNPHQVYPSDNSMPRGIIGVAIHLSAHRVGDPARLYIRAVHPEGPAFKIGLEHGDEILAVDGTSLQGKTYEQILRMIRGDIGQNVTLTVSGTRGKRDLAVTRISEEMLTGKKRT